MAPGCRLTHQLARPRAHRVRIVAIAILDPGPQLSEVPLVYSVSGRRNSILRSRLEVIPALAALIEVPVLSGVLQRFLILAAVATHSGTWTRWWIESSSFPCPWL